jgi:hypothetical protein
MAPTGIDKVTRLVGVSTLLLITILIGGELGLEHARGDGSFALDLRRRQQVSFLDEAEHIEDWESALRIRWHP